MKHRRGYANLSSALSLHSRRLQRQRKRQKLNTRLAVVFGALIGLSVTSMVLANSMQGTRASFTDQETAAGMFSTAKDFPVSDQQLAHFAEAASQAASAHYAELLQVVDAVQNAPTSDEAKDLAANVSALVKQVQADMAQAQNYKSQLDAIVNRDLQDYQNAEQAVLHEQHTVNQISSSEVPSDGSQGTVSSLLPGALSLSNEEQGLDAAQTHVKSLQAVADSYKRVVGWASEASAAGTAAVQQAMGKCADPAHYVNVVNGIITQKKAAEAAAIAKNPASSLETANESGSTSGVDNTSTSVGTGTTN
ncbi:hypothetical protein [Alicyclobacillus ferrooxydans]|uniref:Uncharacterized protein n=1 Tax=Alicyclobacillus ferrooxydans TaxID=471514 RepID=A0A0N8PNT7_9BACL|nr:hypothetical protein [Alicyclobacillus ferrooxydans]KPV42437.1 hypothetical protein AN477_17750 [Alicyclobacillus ferrooxydans]